MKKALLFLVVFACSFLCSAERRDALSLEGRWSYSFSYDNKICDLRGDRVVNRSSSNRTFRLSFFLSKYPYNGGTVYGYEVGACIYDYLRSGYQYNDINMRAEQFRHQQPPSGVYYPVIFVMESRNGVFGIVDYLTFRDSMYFSNSNVSYAMETSFREYDSLYASDPYDQIADGIEKIADSMAKIIIITNPRPAPPPPRHHHHHRRNRPPRR